MPSITTIGRLIADLGGLRTFPQKIDHFGRIVKRKPAKVLRKPKHFKALYPGHMVAFDTIELVIFGKKYYIITCEDIFTRVAFAWATCSHASLAAKEFFERVTKLFPFPVANILTDNGSEFKKHFTQSLLALCLAHYHTYPKQPKMNAHLERFNRTIQEEFVNYHTGALLNPDVFNRLLIDWLDWYNTRRVHWAFANKLSPLQFVMSLKVSELTQMPQGCKMGGRIQSFVFFGKFIKICAGAQVFIPNTPIGSADHFNQHHTYRFCKAMRNKLTANLNGFTLIELLVVIAIIGILSGMVLVSMGGARWKARDAKRMTDMKQLITAQEFYMSDNARYYTCSTTGGDCGASRVIILPPSARACCQRQRTLPTMEQFVMALPTCTADLIIPQRRRISAIGQNLRKTEHRI